MRDILHKKHKNCGGTFREINIWEEIRCDKCDEGSERYIYTKKEQDQRKDAEIIRLIKEITELEGKLEEIHRMSK